MTNSAPKYPVRTLDKAIEILNILYNDNDYRGMGVTEISKKSGLNKSVVHRIMDTLLYSGFVEKDPDTSRYRLGWGLYTLAQKVPQQNHLYSLSINYLIELSKEISGNVNLGILRDKESMIISKVESRSKDSILKISTQVGETEAAYATSLGKMILSDKDDEEIRALFSEPGTFFKMTENTIMSADELIKVIHEVRKNGYAIDNEELVIGITCIARPVKDYTGRIVAAISVSMPSVILTDDVKSHVLDRLDDCCRNVSRALGYMGL